MAIRATPLIPAGLGVQGHAVRLSELAGQARSAQRRLRRDADWHPGLFLQEGEHIESVLLRGVVVVHGALDRPPRLACATSRGPLGSPNAAN